MQMGFSYDPKTIAEHFWFRVIIHRSFKGTVSIINTVLYT